MEISSLIMEIMREKNIMRDRKWNFPPCFCIIRDRKCQKQGRKITFLGIFFPRGRKNAKTGKEFGIEGKKDYFYSRKKYRYSRQVQLYVCSSVLYSEHALVCQAVCDACHKMEGRKTKEMFLDSKCWVRNLETHLMKVAKKPQGKDARRNSRFLSRKLVELLFRICHHKNAMHMSFSSNAVC